jgi:ABC-type methionine transport system permease subunit
MHKILSMKDRNWFYCWLAGIFITWIWNKINLNPPALRQIELAFLNTLLVACMVIILSLLFGWAMTMLLHYSEQRQMKISHYLLSFFLSIIRSIPQIIGILLGYIIMTVYIEQGGIYRSFIILFLISFVISLFVFYEIVDMLGERIAYFKTLDYFYAMLVCGIKEFRIINLEIILKNSLAHLINKSISIFGMTIFLQCSVDFIISVGLTQQASSVNFPFTLGSLLAKIDSKQDILAIGHTLTNPGYFSNLFLQHLQGITIVFLIIFTLTSIYQIGNNYAERKQI